VANETALSPYCEGHLLLKILNFTQVFEEIELAIVQSESLKVRAPHIQV